MKLRLFGQRRAQRSGAQALTALTVRSLVRFRAPRCALLVLAATAALSAADWQPVFNGKDLDGWKQVGPGRFVVENGLMKTEGGMGLLYYTKEKLGRCTIRVVFRQAADRSNSGVVIRLPEPPPDPWYGVHNGYEVQIAGAGDAWHSTGSIYSLSAVTARPQKPVGEWNTMEIEIDGQKTVVHLNGEKVNEYDGRHPSPDRKQWYEPVRGPRPDSGYFGLQNHGERDTVYFREVSIRKK